MHDQQCKQNVYSDRSSWRCNRKATKDGYCWQHHPDAVKKRDEKMSKRIDIEMKFDSMQSRIHYFHRKCVNFVFELSKRNRKAKQLASKINKLEQDCEKLREKLDTL